jgi:hypothetical protein
MVKKKEGSWVESSFNQNYIILRNKRLSGMIESINPRNSESKIGNS